MYSALLGIFAIGLSIAVLRRQEGHAQVPGAAPAAVKPAH
jgi:hypothetical protein